jgi:hypothetical protein
MKTTEFRLPDYHRLRSTIPDHSTTLKFYHSTPGQADQIQMLPQPHTRNARRLSHAHGLAPSPFAHHYSGNHYCFLFLRVLRCFTSPRYHQPPYQFRRRQHPMTGAGLPHSETPGSTLGCQLPGAYRRLPRPSSAPDAKASTVCPKKLEHNKIYKMLAFTMQFSKHERTPTHNHHQTTRNPNNTRNLMRYGGRTGPHAQPDPPNHGGTQPKRPEDTDTRPEGPSARFLRTQQCAHNPPRPHPLVPTPDPQTGAGRY